MRSEWVCVVGCVVRRAKGEAWSAGSKWGTIAAERELFGGGRAGPGRAEPRSRRRSGRGFMVQGME